MDPAQIVTSDNGRPVGRDSARAKLGIAVEDCDRCTRSEVPKLTRGFEIGRRAAAGLQRQEEQRRGLLHERLRAAGVMM